MLVYWCSTEMFHASFNHVTCMDPGWIKTVSIKSRISLQSDTVVYSQIPISIIWWCCYKRNILGDVVCWRIMIMTWAGGVLLYVGVDILVLGVVVVDFYFAFLEVV